jgi:integrase
MKAGVYKICECRDRLKCRHPWWFSFKRRGTAARIRKSLDVVLEKRIDSKTIAEAEASRLRIGIVDNTLPPRTRELLGLPPSTAPRLESLTVAELLQTYRERHLQQTATGERRAYEIGAIARTVIQRPDGTSAALGVWLIADLTADALERLREARRIPGIHTRKGGCNVVGGAVAANRDLRLLRAAFNWAIDKGLAERTPFKRGEKTTVKLTQEQARSRRLQPGEEARLLPACSVHLRAVVEAALETGCRKGELLSLQWSQVQVTPRPEVWLPAGKTKTGRARRVPISTRLKSIIEMQQDAYRAVAGLAATDALPGAGYVFGNEIGQRVGSIKTAWLAACRRATVDDLHFHDLRREAGSRWMEAGVPLATIQRWLGHTNISQTSTYLATTTVGEHEAMRQYEERRGRLTRVDTAGGTPPHEQAQSDTTTDDNTQENLTKH